MALHRLSIRLELFIMDRPVCSNLERYSRNHSNKYTDFEIIIFLLTTMYKYVYPIIILVALPAIIVSLPNGCDVRGIVQTSNQKDGNSYLQVCIENGRGNLIWAFICGEKNTEFPWTYDNAYVWCRTRELKLSSQQSLGSLGKPAPPSPELKLKNVSCNRLQDETILDCEYSTTSEDCDYLHGISCLSCHSDGDCNHPGICNEESEQCYCSSNCENGGFCDVGRCQCIPPFYGASCAVKNCSDTCSNGGHCLEDGTCHCQAGYDGPTCQIKLCRPECRNMSPCLSSGVCDCSLPFHGESCEKVRCGSACLNGGYCLDNGTCSCHSLFYGNSCELKHCQALCLNGGVCNASSGLCQCPPLFNGSRCESEICTSNCNSVLGSYPNLSLVIISAGSTALIVILLLLIAISSTCLFAVIRRKRARPPPSAKSLGLKNLREPEKPSDEPLYEYLDASYVSQPLDKNTATTQFTDSYASTNVYEYIHFPLFRPGTSPGCNPGLPQPHRAASLDITYESPDTPLYERPLPICRAGIAQGGLPCSADRYTESYVKMYPAASSPSLS